ncbi:PilT/PilU family type 4a pilus ATPase, partial [Acinetobacter variabilis]|uniref:PilT/PilU family type 4a pilus ATPase n=1 Tax=Acinetobacter variabilis TaxID=70346 RepID=UPI0028A90B95
HNVGMVIRVITTDIPSFEQLGLPASLQQVIMQKRGLVLIVGATGVGKSTTLAAMIDYRNTHTEGHIITIEDPVEYVYQHKNSMITQREIGVDCVSWHNALINTMRQAPDVIVIGEIRDTDSMEHAIAFAESGHLCLATLHSNNADQALDRIINFFPEERRNQLLMDLSSNMKVIISQRLIRTQDGKGRRAAIEIMLNTPLISDLILKGEFHELKAIMGKSRELGMQTFDQALFDLYNEGAISYEEALRNADSTNELRLQIKLKSNRQDNPAAGEATQFTMMQEPKAEEKEQENTSVSE